MARREQKVRVHFLIALTLTVMAFGGTRFLRIQRQRQRQLEYARTEQELHQYTTKLVSDERQRLQHLAAGGADRVSKDASALLMQVRFYAEQNAGAGRLRNAAPAEAALAAIRSNFQRLKQGQPAVFPRGQPFLRAYYSDADGSFQPYSVCLPPDYDAERSYPLIVRIDAGGTADRFRCRGAPCYATAISLKPEGRGRAGYMGLGEDDVLRAVRETEQLYNVDRSRVYLVGVGNGVPACWYIASRHPELFAGLLIMDGNSGILERKGREPPREVRALGDVAVFLRATLSPLSYAANLVHCHVTAMQTGAPEHGNAMTLRTMVERLRRLGGSVEYLEFARPAGEAQAGWINEYALAKALGRPAARVPAKFRFTTTDLRHDTAWWVRVEQMEAPLRFATVEAEAVGNRVQVTTSNVSRLSILLDRVPVAAKTVSVDGVEFSVPSRGATFRVERRGDRWENAGRAAQSRASPGLFKRKGRSGPVSDVLRDGFTIVWGTQAEDELYNEIMAAEARQFAADWQAQYGGAVPRMASDADVSPEQLAGSGLVLIGGPAVNAVSGMLASGLPVRFEPGGFALGEDRFEGQDMGIVFCYPNPLDTDRMVVMVAANSAAALYQAYQRTAINLAPGAYESYQWFDYAVFDGRTAGPETLLLAGFFDNDWKLSDAEGFCWRRDESALAGLRPQGFPPAGAATVSAESKLLLSDVRPVRVRQAGPVAFDRSTAGKLIRLGGKGFGKGLGVMAPSAISWVIGRRFRTFEATVGLTDPHPGGRECRVVFEVRDHERLLAASPPLGFEKGVPGSATIRADVHDATTLTLAVRLVAGSGPVSGCAWGAPTLQR